jgi:hypothetical protein
MDAIVNGKYDYLEKELQSQESTPESKTDFVKECTKKVYESVDSLRKRGNEAFSKGNFFITFHKCNQHGKILPLY